MSLVAQFKGGAMTSRTPGVFRGEEAGEAYRAKQPMNVQRRARKKGLVIRDEELRKNGISIEERQKKERGRERDLPSNSTRSSEKRATIRSLIRERRL